ncbi:hypothetical protein CHS0354_019431 [Potamilus streckersoni]|uniref:Uncharacterized protein n=1 Tax=Potamilus streckersoni TaxID=2493646 RepID=A0AAE0VVZ4_9BIVA|nr:hypothetical protein CHS0354_019431 [Potamilus streckersoni]
MRFKCLKFIPDPKFNFAKINTGVTSEPTIGVAPSRFIVFTSVDTPCVWTSQGNYCFTDETEVLVHQDFVIHLLGSRWQK